MKFFRRCAMQLRGFAVNQGLELVACKLFCADRSATAARQRPQANDLLHAHCVLLQLQGFSRAPYGERHGTC